VAMPAIGRDAECAAIRQWLEADRPATLLIEGVAGIGKSTLVSFARRPGISGRRSFSVRYPASSNSRSPIHPPHLAT
jgi:hypothetical protein